MRAQWDYDVTCIRSIVYYDFDSDFKMFSWLVRTSAWFKPILRVVCSLYVGPDFYQLCLCFSVPSWTGVCNRIQLLEKKCKPEDLHKTCCKIVNVIDIMSTQKCVYLYDTVDSCYKEDCYNKILIIFLVPKFKISLYMYFIVFATRI